MYIRPHSQAEAVGVEVAVSVTLTELTPQRREVEITEEALKSHLLLRGYLTRVHSDSVKAEDGLHLRMKAQVEMREFSWILDQILPRPADSNRNHDLRREDGLHQARAKELPLPQVTMVTAAMTTTFLTTMKTTKSTMMKLTTTRTAQESMNTNWTRYQ